VKLVAGVFLAAALAAVALAALTSFAGWPLARGRWLVGGTLATWGAAALLLFAALNGAAAFGMWRLHNWGRRLAALLAAAGVALLVPEIASAVTDAHLLPILRVGAGTVVRLMILQYLWRSDVRDAFAR
jgi:uncharacterized membrane protein (DUF2068 family)